MAETDGSSGRSRGRLALGVAVLVIVAAVPAVWLVTRGSAMEEDVVTFTTVDETSDDSTRLVVEPAAYYTDSCWEPDHTVEETDDTVTVTLRYRKPEGAFCTLEGNSRPRAEVRLEEPLGDRGLVDGAASDPGAVRWPAEQGDP